MSYTIASPYALASSASGAASGFSNTAQTGDLSNWFSWTCPATGYYRFDTRGLYLSQPAGPTFPTTLLPYQLSATPHSPVILDDLTALATTEVHTGQEGGGPTASLIAQEGFLRFENGALVALAFTAGTTYYFQVNSRDGVSTGTFSLEWKPFSFVTLGSCGSCTPAQTGLCQISSLAIPNWGASGDFGVVAGIEAFYIPQPSPTPPTDDLPAGFYFIVYCGGAVLQTSTGAPPYGYYFGPGFPYGIGLIWNQPLPNNPDVLFFNSINQFQGWWPGAGEEFAVDYPAQVGDLWYESDGLFVCTTAVDYPAYSTLPALSSDPNWTAIIYYSQSGVNMPPNNNNAGGNYSWNGETWPTQQDAEIAAACQQFGFCHYGGPIALTWFGAESDTPGNPNPSFALFAFYPSQQLKLSVSNLTNLGASGSGYNYSVTVNVTNGNLNYFSGPVTLQMNNANGISNVAAAGGGAGASYSGNQVLFAGTVSGGNGGIDPGETNTATFTFYSANLDLLVGEFQFLNCVGNSDGNPIELTLAEAAWAIAWGEHTACVGACLSDCLYSDQINVTNLTPIPLTNVQMILTAPALLFAPSYIIDQCGQGSVAEGCNPTPCCALTPSIDGLTINTGVIAPGSYAYAHIAFQRQLGSPTAQTITITSSDGASTVPNFTYTPSPLR